MQATKRALASYPPPIGFEPSDQQIWRTGPLCPAFWQHEVHVWKIDLAMPWSDLFSEALAPEDRAEAARYRFALDRHRFSVARAALRLILARYLSKSPSALILERGAYGKPRLADDDQNRGIRFNVSHSNQLALIAIARDREVGVDIEFKKAEFGTDDIAGRFFSAGEVRQLKELPRELRTEAFFNCWTRKEAYIKGRGEGLSMPLDQFDVSLAPGQPPELLDNRFDPKEIGRWAFQNLFPAPGFAATLAVEGAFSKLLLWEFVS